MQRLFCLPTTIDRDMVINYLQENNITILAVKQKPEIIGKHSFVMYFLDFKNKREVLLVEKFLYDLVPDKSRIVIDKENENRIDIKKIML